MLPALCRTFLWRGFAPGFVNYKKGCTPLAATSDKIYQLLVHGRWFSPGTPAASTTKTGHHENLKNFPNMQIKLILRKNLLKMFSSEFTG
jgi:hypothetical protein